MTTGTFTSLTSTSLTSTNASITTLTAPTINSTTINAQSVSSKDITSTGTLNAASIVSGNMSGANAYFVNLAAESSAFQGTTVGFNGLTVVGNAVLLQNLYATGYSGAGYFNELHVSTGSLYIGDNVILTAPDNRNLSVNSGLLVNNGIVASSGTIGNLSVGSISISSFVVPTGTITNLTSTNATIANLFSTTGSITSLSSQSISSKDMTSTGTINANNVSVSGNMSGANAYFINLASEQLAAQGATLGFNGLTSVGNASFLQDVNIIGTTGVDGRLIASNIAVTTLTGTNVYAQNLVALGGSLTMTTGTFTSLTSTSLISTSASITTLTAPTINSTTINAQSVSSKDITSTGTLNAASIVSGNMSGANAYFVNLAAESSAFQGTTVGFNGLSVVGNAVLLQNLYATGYSGASYFNELHVSTGSLYIGDNVILTAPDNRNLSVNSGLLVNNGIVASSGSITNLTTSKINSTNATITNLTGTNIKSNNIKTTDIQVDNQIIMSSGSFIGAATGADTLYVDCNMNVSNVFTINAVNGNVEFSEYYGGVMYPNITIDTQLGAIYATGAGLGVAYFKDLRVQNQRIRLGIDAGYTGQGALTTAVGGYAGTTNQGQAAVAIGYSAGNLNQGLGAVALGGGAGSTNQKENAVALGNSAGGNTQGTGAVAIGYSAGSVNQGEYSIAIGAQAGLVSQFKNSIILNATNTQLDSYTGGFFVNPIRQPESLIIGENIHSIFYQDLTKEVVKDPNFYYNSETGYAFGDDVYPISSASYNLGHPEYKWNQVIAQSVDTSTIQNVTNVYTTGTVTFAGGAGAGDGSYDIAVTGSNTSGKIFVSCSGASTAGQPIVTITYANPYATIPTVVFSPANGNSALVSNDVWVSNINTTDFALVTTAGNLINGDQYKWNYHVIA